MSDDTFEKAPDKDLKPKWPGRLDEGWARLEKGLLVLMMALLIGLSLFNIVARLLWGGASQAAAEMVPVLVLWLALVGGSLGVRYNKHICFQLLRSSRLQFLQPVARRLVGLFGVLVLMGLGLCAFQYALNEISLFGWKGSAALAYPYFCLSAGSRLAGWFLSRDSFKDVPSWN